MMQVPLRVRRGVIRPSVKSGEAEGYHKHTNADATGLHGAILGKRHERRPSIRGCVRTAVSHDQDDELLQSGTFC